MHPIHGMTQVAPSRSTRYLPQGGPAVAYGHGALGQLSNLADQIGAERLLVMTCQSLDREGSLISAVLDNMGRRVAGVFSGCREHTPDTTVEAACTVLKTSHADAIISIGGSSVVDTAKAAALSSSIGVDLSAFWAARESSPDGALRMRRGALHDQLFRVRRGVAEADRTLQCATEVLEQSVPPIIAVPTTLSGAEFTDHAGVTYTETGVKRQVYHPQILPRAVVLDPQSATTTPSRLWTSTGIKVLDHAVEIVGSPYSSPVSKAACLDALRRIFLSLAASVDPENIQARYEMFVAAWLTLASYPNQFAGVNHGIGHQLGGLLGVPHGIAAGCTLPHTMRFNRQSAAEAYALMAQAFTRATNEPATPDAVIEAVDDLLASLNLPRRLRDVGVHREALPAVAEMVISVEAGVVGNPRPVQSADEILIEILEPAW